MSNNTPVQQALPILPRQNHHLQQPQPNAGPPPQASDTGLPEGECKFIVPRAGKQERCDCVAFTLDRDRVGSLCGCSHPAWVHVRTHAGDGVSREEFEALVGQTRELRAGMTKLHDEMQRQWVEREQEKKQLKHEFHKLFEAIVKVKMIGEHNVNAAHQSLDSKISGLDQRMTKTSAMSTHLEDRIEAVVDKTSSWDTLVRKVEMLDEACMTLEDKVDKVEPPSTEGVFKMLSPVPEVASSEVSPSTVPVDNPHPHSWTIKVILVPKKEQRFAFAHDSVEWRRCYSRGLHQDLRMLSQSAEDFNKATEASFKQVLQGRAWAPLVCLSSDDKSLSQLPPGQNQPRCWDKAFLERHCVGLDKLDGDIMYIAPTQDPLTWTYIRNLSPVPRADETCWEHSQELDGFSSLNFSRPQRSTPLQSQPSSSSTSTITAVDEKAGGLPFGNSTFSNFGLRKASMDSDATIWDNSPPPYTTGGSIIAPPRTHDDQQRLHSFASIALNDPNRDQNNTDNNNFNVIRPVTSHIFDHRTLPRPHTSGASSEHSMSSMPFAPPSLPPPSSFMNSGSVAMDMEIDDDAISTVSRPTTSRPPTRGQASGDPGAMPSSVGLSRSGSGSTNHSNEKQQQAPQQYFSGRTKRKTTGKYKEPVSVSVADMKLPKFNFHRHTNNSDDKQNADTNMS